MLIYNNIILKKNGHWIGYTEPPTPSLPPYTIRLRYAVGTTPPEGRGTLTLVSAEDNIWDLTYEDYDWGAIRNANDDLLEIIDANIIGVRYLSDAFTGCDNLYNVNLFDTSTITVMDHMFYQCYALQNVPLFNTTNVKDMTQMFQDCYAVKSGALALYNQASSQATPPRHYQFCFKNCGRDTSTGAAELAQIPSEWK